MSDTPNHLSLNRDTMPSDAEINAAYERAMGESALLTGSASRYRDVVRLYALSARIPEFEEIAAAAAVGDPQACALEWALISREIAVIGGDTDAAPGDMQEDRDKAADLYEERYAGQFDGESPLPEAETLDMLDASIMVAEGAIALARMKKSDPVEADEASLKPHTKPNDDEE